MAAYGSGSGRSVGAPQRVLGVIAGRDEHDQTSLPDPVPDYEAEIDQGVGGLRIGWDESFASQTATPNVVSAVRDAVEQLAGLGAEIVDVRVPSLEAEEHAAWTTLASAPTPRGQATRRGDYGLLQLIKGLFRT